MNPRMKDKGILAQPKNDFQIRNPWIPLTPGNQISNGISIDRNGNQLGRRNQSEFFELLDRRSKQTSNYNTTGDDFNLPGPLNQSSGSHHLNDQRMGNAIFIGSNSSIITRRVDQSSGIYDMSNHRMGNGILRDGNNFNLNRPTNQVSSLNSMVNHRMENGNSGHYLHSQAQTYHNDMPSRSNNPMASNRVLIGNGVQQPSFPSTNMSPNMIPKSDPVISSPFLNPNMQPLSLPGGMNRLNSPNAPSILNSYSEVDSSWTEGNFTSLLLGDEIPPFGPNKWLNANNSPQMLNSGFDVPVQHYYNLNSPPRHGGNAGASNANSFLFAPITPDQTNLLQKHRQAEMLKFLVEDGSYQEHDKMENLLSSIGNEAIENRCSELLQTIVNSTVASTPQAENKISEERGVQEVIDLNETPKEKAPKRQKHRPKVVIEGKPKRTPKQKTPKKDEPGGNPPRKRKYERKNRDPEVVNVTQPMDATNAFKVPNFESQKKSCRKRLNFDFKTVEQVKSSAQIQVALHQGNQPAQELNLNFPANQVPVVESSAGEESRSLAGPSGITNKTLNLIARNLSMKNKGGVDNRILPGELNKNISRPNINIERSREIRWKSTHQMVERDVGNFKGFYGSKGEDSQPIGQVGPSTVCKFSSTSMCQEQFRSENQETTIPTVANSSEETRKKQKMENKVHTMLYGQEKAHSINGSGESTINAQNHMLSKLTALKQQILLERMRNRMPSTSNQVHGTGYHAVMSNSNLRSAISSKSASVTGYQEGNENYQATMQNNRFTVPANPCRVVSFCTNKAPLQGHKDTLHQYQQPSMTARGQPKAMKYSKKMVDEITSRLQSLSIRDENGEIDGKDKYALVPYEGGGAVVLYEPKKRKPRPKVDLDPETTRIWKLLMGKEGTEAPEAENRDKEKWWEEERRVFQGRADSFIARMHLVQGDRRFSPWKGSVVDSIIGVFLTQNVSDQLSSSAFMALAAQFPLGIATPDQSGTSIVTEEPESQGLYPNGTIRCIEKIIRQPFYSQTSETYLGSLGTGKIGLATEPNQITEGNASSSPNSSVSSVHHNNGENQSSSGSNSEAEDSSNGGKFIKNSGLMREECRSSFPLRAPANIDPFAFLTKHLTVQKSNAQLEPPFGKDLLYSNAHQVERSQMYESKHKGFENPSGPVEPVIMTKSGSRDQVPNISNHRGSTFDIQEGTAAANKQVFLGDQPNDGHAKVQACFSGETNVGISAKNLNTSQKREKEKREQFEWDSLRKKTQSNGKGKERSKDASDSMDYEAMRCADVNLISNSIKIRGMNNMLSERIQDFLNRVARDHGSIDLEWLRDVPPDKAKDYLLSIRGLGLKSVECVRLLTLHHLAFPVDTNVGRIAVRLGWVPLQPLPESLQLHLLEMYPVLESVQKYLWPRLCKLDQKTLYELHYQLITFGKVFCTKSKPNCNACPMRGECRHFASAFASARLALPAPEEKGIVGSTMSFATDRRADVTIKPMLPQPSGRHGEELMVSRCEPIIEEPATPEPEITEIAETDIEDAFYEDPDEIPTIRLNVEQLAVNLRNFMEEHTDLQEGDMSKALVALTPEVASIPVPKLKYVLRLRTERQVYVLTDTHPLVKGLDKREPDDPSPYLLALLAPGEEAGSSQPSGRCCDSNGSGVPCKEKECSSVKEEANSLTVRGTLLIPCRTAMRGSFPLNGTYFQVNEVFADHESSLNPIDVPRTWLWRLETRTVFFGTSATSIFRGMTTKEIQNSFWRGFVCVRGFDRETRAPRPLNRNLHIPHSKTMKTSKAA